MDLSIIIVNWNSKEYLKNCIASIEAATKGIQFEIVVIDNASFDGCDEMLRRFYPWVQFIQSDRNVGFAKANNAAFKVSHGLNVLFLNPDTELKGPAIEILYHQLCSLPSAGVIGPKLVNGDGSVQSTCVRSFPTLLSQLLESKVLRRLLPHSGLWGMAPLFEQTERSSEVDAVSGACLMIKRSVFESVGMFSTDYFMYSEDLDLCFKVREAGWKTYYVPTAIVVHHGGLSSSQSSVDVFSSVMILESRWRFFQKTRSLWYCWLYRLAMFSSSVIRIGMVLLIWPALSVRGRSSLPTGTLKTWTARLRWTVGFEKWVKNY